MGRTLKGLMDESCARWADLTAVRVLDPVGDSGKQLEYRPISYRQLDEQRRGLASGLAQLGLVKGQRVGVLTDGGFEPLLVFLAADFLGLSTVPLCNKVSNAVLRHNIDHSGVDLLVVDGTELTTEGDLIVSHEARTRLYRNLHHAGLAGIDRNRYFRNLTNCLDQGNGPGQLFFEINLSRAGDR